MRREAAARAAWAMPSPVLERAGAASPWLLAGAAASFAVGLALGFSIAPADLGRTDLYRIIFIHVPATWAMLLLYALLVSCSALLLMTERPEASMLAEAIAPTGALFALLALWTGSMWSKAVTGHWWGWDVRWLADLALLASFVASVLLREAVDDPARCDVPCAVLVLAGAAIVVFALHAVDLAPRVGSHPEAAAHGNDARLFVSLAAVTAGFLAYGAAAVFKRLRCVLLERGRDIEPSGQGRVRR